MRKLHMSIVVSFRKNETMDVLFLRKLHVLVLGNSMLFSFEITCLVRPRVLDLKPLRTIANLIQTIRCVCAICISHLLAWSTFFGELMRT